VWGPARGPAEQGKGRGRAAAQAGTPNMQLYYRGTEWGGEEQEEGGRGEGGGGGVRLGQGEVAATWLLF